MAKAKAASIDILVSVIFGIGGKERSKDHIAQTTKLLNIMQPEQIAPMALAIQPGTELQKQVEAGDFNKAAPLQILEEETYLLEHLAGLWTISWVDHGNNIVASKGTLSALQDQFLE